MTDEEIVQVAEQTAWKLLKDDLGRPQAQDWEDVRQEVALALMEAHAQIEAADSPAAYVRRVAWNAALLWATDWKTRRTVPFSAFQSIDALAIEALAVRRDGFWTSATRERNHVEAILDRDTIAFALAHVSAEAGEALRLKYEYEHTWGEVGEKVGKSTEATKKMCQRAIQHIRKRCPD